MRIVVAVIVLLGSFVAPAAASAEASEPGLRLAARPGAVALDRWVGLPDGRIVLPRLNLGVDVVAGNASFELRLTRRSYSDPIVVTQVTGRGSRALPAGLATDFSGLSAFFHVTLTNAAGTRVVDRHSAFCPNSNPVRIGSDAVAASRYPVSCSINPFTRGQLWGVERGWGADARSPGAETVDVPDGAYTAAISVNEPYRSLFGFPAAALTVPVTARTRQSASTGAPAVGTGPPSAEAPAVAGDVLRPDLQPLPAWNLQVSTKDGRDQLAFNATILNAGPGRMAVSGTRRPGADIMDSRQLFYDADGRQVGSRPAGTMEWDPRTGHLHWHFTDFAVYRLLGADQREAVRSQKEAFCLANTDGIDLLVRNAVLKPPNTDPRTSCGGYDAQTVQQRLDVGWGDTYRQSLPGQSFDVTDLPNGTYHVEVTANPRRAIAETSTSNNTSLRRITLAGAPGARTVAVSAVGRVTGDSPAGPEVCQGCACVMGGC